MQTAQVPKLEAQVVDDYRKLRFEYFLEQSVLHTYTKRPLTAFVTLAYANDGKYQIDFTADTENAR